MARADREKGLVSADSALIGYVKSVSAAAGNRANANRTFRPHCTTSSGRATGDESCGSRQSYCDKASIRSDH
jgi:hypothetical protein